MSLPPLLPLLLPSRAPHSTVQPEPAMGACASLSLLLLLLPPASSRVRTKCSAASSHLPSTQAMRPALPLRRTISVAS